MKQMTEQRSKIPGWALLSPPSLNRKPYTQNPRSYTPNPKPTLNPTPYKPQTLNPKPSTLNPKTLKPCALS